MMKRNTIAELLQNELTIHNSRHRVWALRDINEVSVKLRNLQDFRNEIADDLKAAQKIENKKERIEKLRKIQIAQMKAGDCESVKTAASIFHIKHGLGEENENDYLRAVDLVSAANGLDEKVATVKRIENEDVRVWAFNLFSLVLFKDEMPEKALEMFNLAMESANDDILLLTRLAVWQSEAGQNERANDAFFRAINIAQDIEDHSEKATALGNIAETQRHVGMLECARETIKVALMFGKIISYLPRRIKMLIELSRILFLLDERKLAKSALDSVLKSIINFEDRDHADYLNDIALILLESGEYDWAQEMFLSALKTVQRIDTEYQQIFALSSLAFKQKNAGAREWAHETIAVALELVEMIDEYYQGDALWGIAFGQAQAGDISTALEIALRIEDKEHRERAIEVILETKGKTDYDEQTLTDLEETLANRGKDIRKLEKHFETNDNKKKLKLSLIPSAYYIDTAYRMCGLLARMYPEQAKEISEIVLVEK